MKVNISAPLIGLDGKPMMDPRNPGETTLRDLLVIIYQSELPMDRQKSFQDKLDLFEKAKYYKFVESDEIEMTIKDIAEAQDRFAAMYPPAVIGAINAILPR